MSSIYGIVNKLNLSANDKMKEMSSEMLRWNPDNAGVYFSPSHVRYVNAVPVSIPEALNSKGIEAADAVSALFNEIPENSNVAMGCSMLWNTPESLHEFLPLYDNEAQLCLTADARIDNREELAVEFGYNWNDVSDKPDSWFILEAYKKWHNNCPKYLIGDFAFAIWNEKKQEMFLSRDIYGVRPLYYTHNENFIAFASNLRGLLTLDVDKSHDEQWLIDIAAGLHSEAWRSLYSSIRKLEPSHYLIYKNNTITVERYFEFDLNKEITVTDEKIVHAEVKRLTEQAIKCRMRSIYPLGSEMSSGLDSSVITILGHRIKEANQKFIQFSHVLPEWSEYKTEHNIDEQRGIEEICNYAQLPMPVWVTAEGKGYIEAFENFYEKVGEISTSTFPVLSDSLLEKATEQKVRTIFSGYGGDECVSHSGAGYFPELLLRNEWKRFFTDMRKACKRNNEIFWRKAGYEILRTKATPLFNVLNNNWMQPRKLKKEITEMQIDTDLIKDYNLAARIQNRTPRTNFATIRARQVKRLSHTYIQYRYEYSNLLAEASHITYTYPLTDKRLTEYVLALPYSLKYGSHGRYLMRTLAQGLLPEKYVMRKKGGAAISNSVERVIYNNQ
jgi:asparagine synthase (glutamine-hydrolysing)